jgi:hypothetical protein
MITHYYDLEQGTEEWLQVRCGLITASVFHKLITQATNKPAKNDTSRKLLEELLTQRILGKPTETYQSQDMLTGSLEEPAARAIYARERAVVEECGFITRKRSGVTIGYSPDGLVGTRGLIEIKRPKPENQVARIIKKEIPSAYLWQMHVGLCVTGRHWCDFISYCPGLPMMIERVRRDPEKIGQIWLAAYQAEATILEMRREYNRSCKKYPNTEPLDGIFVL